MFTGCKGAMLCIDLLRSQVAARLQFCTAINVTSCGIWRKKNKWQCWRRDMLESHQKLISEQRLF